MEEYDLTVVDRQSHSRAASSFCQCSDNYSDRFGASRIIYDPDPFFEFAALVPSGVFDVLKPGLSHASIQLRWRQHANMRGITQSLYCILQA